MAITISTIIPAYNCEKTLGRALDSILNQTYLPDEIIVINDGSTDNTAHVIEFYAKQYAIIRSVTQKNSGPAIARNHGVKLAKSDWVSFLDSDDYWFPWHLKNLVSVIESHPALLWAAASYEKEKAIRTTKPFSRSSVLPSYLAIAHHPQNPVHTNTTLVRRSAFSECGGFHEDWRRAEDLWLWLQLGLRYPQLGYSPVISSFYGYQPTSLTNQASSCKKELDLTIFNTDQMVQDLKTQKFLGREDVQVYLGGRVSKILFLSLCVSYHEYRKSRKRYRSFLPYVRLPLDMRIYVWLSLLGISPLRFKSVLFFLFSSFRKCFRKKHPPTKESIQTKNLSLETPLQRKNHDVKCHST